MTQLRSTRARSALRMSRTLLRALPSFFQISKAMRRINRGGALGAFAQDTFQWKPGFTWDGKIASATTGN